MKVKFLTAVAGKDFVYNSGEVISLPAAEAEEYIRLGRAEEVKEKKKPVQKPVTVQEVKKAATRPVTRKATTKKK